MSFPAEAFVRVRVADTACGAFVLVRGNWVFRCQFSTSNGPADQVLWMTGESAGHISGVPDEIGLAIAQGFQAQIRVPSPLGLVPTYDSPARSLVFAEGGALQYWGHIRGAPEYAYGFDLSGRDVTPKNVHGSTSFLRTKKFDVWLAKDGAPVGENALFSVNHV